MSEYCGFCGEEVTLTDVIRDAWQQTPAEDADVMTEDLSVTWTFTQPRQVKLRELSCGCWRVVKEPGS